MGSPLGFPWVPLDPPRGGQGPPRGEKKGKIEKIKFPLKNAQKTKIKISKIVDTSGPNF